MKVNYICRYKPPYNSYTNNIKKNSVSKQNNCTNLCTFSGISDLFKKTVNTPEQETSKIVAQNIKSARKANNALAKCGKAFLKELNDLIEIGSKKDYRGYFPYVKTEKETKNITYSDVDESLGVPSVINIWHNGKLDLSYKIYSVIPQSIFGVKYFDDGCTTNYIFAGKELLSYEYTDDKNNIIRQFPSKDGFYQQSGEKIDNTSTLLLSEVYLDNKNIENSYFKQLEKDGTQVFKYNTSDKMWKCVEIIDGVQLME